MRSRPILRLAAVLLWLLDPPGTAHAGMPTVTLTDLARMRVQSISFFLMVFLVCALVVRWAWNALRADFPRLPRLDHGKAVGVTALWGLLFLLVLTMISGARELMTPGAWKPKDGAFTSTLAGPEAVEAAESASRERDDARRRSLEALRLLLWSYAGGHDGRFPPDRDVTAVPDAAWRVPDPSRMPYVYVGGLHADPDGNGRLLAVEPDLFNGPRLALWTDGSIRPLGNDEVREAMNPESPREGEAPAEPTSREGTPLDDGETPP